MSVRGLSSSERINLEKAHILLLDASAHGLEIMVQIMTGFGMRNFYRCQKVEEAQTIVRAKPVDLFIVDPNFGDADGYEFLKWLRRSGIEPNCHAPIILVSGYPEVHSAVEAIKKGAFDFLEKPVNGGLLVEKVQSALARSRQMHAELLTRKTREARLALLTPKERQIAELVVEGKSSPKIAEVLDISVRTVENHRARLMEKLHVESTIELVKMFL